MNEILDRSPKVEWDDIAGLKFAKDVVYEMVVWPMQRSEFFTGLRTPPKGLLLFGPPVCLIHSLLLFFIYFFLLFFFSFSSTLVHPRANVLF